MRLFFLALSALALAHIASAEVKVQSYERKINLASQYARITETIKVKNTGDQTVKSIVLCHARQQNGVVAYHKITQGKDDLKFKSTTVEGAPAEATCWEVQLAEALASGAVASVDSFAVYADVQTPYPKEIGQGEAQLVLYLDNVYVLSPYQVSTQNTEVVLPSSNVKSYTDTEKPVSKSDSKIKFGKYDLVKPWSVKELRVHYENGKTFKKAVSLVREIEVSHWGNIYVEEQYELKNAGALHKGAFSRLKYAHSYNGKGNSFRDLKARLPASAHSLYYVDIIGNISSSNTRKTSTETVLDFETRYPLMGGWKVDFKLGYGVPLKGYLFSKRSDGKRRLTMDFSTPLEDVYVEDLTVRIVLPEGASAISASLPYEVEQGADVKFTYLDITGRPVVVLHKKYVVPEHAAKFNVDYAFSSTSNYREPLLLITAFAALFAAVIVYNRLEFTISRDDKWQATQQAEKIATVMQHVNSIIDEQDEILDSIVKLLWSVRSAEDADASQREKAQLEAAFTQLENKAKALVADVATTQPRVAEKVRDVQEKSRSLQQRYIKQLGERSDLVRKNTPALEVNKKTTAAVNALQESRNELAKAVETLFAPY